MDSLKFTGNGKSITRKKKKKIAITVKLKVARLVTMFICIVALLNEIIKNRKYTKIMELFVSEMRLVNLKNEEKKTKVI